VIAADTQLLAVATSQDGVFSREQARSLGISRRTVSRRLTSAAWLNPVGDVFVLAGSRPSWRQRVRIALLNGGEGAAVSRYTSLTLQGLRCFVDADVDIVVPHPRHVTAPGVRYHQITDLVPQHVTTIHGMSVTRAERAIVDCSAVMTVPRLGLIFDDAVTSGLSSTEQVADCLGQLIRPNKRGLNVIAAVLDERGSAAALTQSVAEALFLRTLRLEGLPEPVTQFQHPAPWRLSNFVDFAWPLMLVIVEIDGRTWHERVRDRRRDAERDRAAQTQGWQVVRIPVEDLRRDRHAVVSEVGQILAARAA